MVVGDEGGEVLGARGKAPTILAMIGSLGLVDAIVARVDSMERE